MLTASALARIEACPSSYNLPQFGHLSEASKSGVALHKFMEDCCTMGSSMALENVPPEYLEACQILALEDLPVFKPGAFAAEVAFAFDLTTYSCRELGRGIGREYIEHGAHPTNDVCMSADVVGVTDNDVVVIDWKTGWTAVEPSSLQLRALGMAALTAYGKARAHILIYRLRDGEVSHLSGVLDAMDAGVVMEEIAHIERTAINAGTSQLVTGTQCKFCPALPGCPAQAALVNALSLEGGSALTAADVAATLTVDKVRRAWAVFKAAEYAVERGKEACKLFAATTPCELDNGKVLGPVETEKESVDAGVVHKLLAKDYGVEVADSVVEMAVTKTDLNAALKAQAVARGTPYAPMKEAFYDKIRDAGGSRVRTTTSVREHSAKKESA